MNVARRVGPFAAGTPKFVGVVVLGQVARDLVLRVEQLPGEGGSEAVAQRVERLGGKGANQAVGLAQLGARVALVGVVGMDDDGGLVSAQAAADGIDVAHVARRGRTALLVALVDGGAGRMLVEDIPESALLTVDDVERAAPAIDAADIVSIQLQQPVEAALAAARRARAAGARVVADGAVELGAVDELLGSIDVLRADAAEAEQLAGEPVGSADHAREVAVRLLERGPALVALAVPEAGDVLAWRGGHRLFPLSDAQVVDRTGAGDAFMAGLITALRHGASPAGAGDMATRAARATVTRLGGRPDLTKMTRGQTI